MATRVITLLAFSYAPEAGQNQIAVPNNVIWDMPDGQDWLTCDPPKAKLFDPSGDQNLADEIAARINADEALQQAIAEEATARQNADTALQASLDDALSAKADVAFVEDLQTEVDNTALGLGQTQGTGFVYSTMNNKALADALLLNFKQSGNTYGATAVLGTNDAFDLAIRANASERLRLKSSVDASNIIAQISGGDLNLNGICIGKGKSNSGVLLGAPTYAAGTVIGANNIIIGSPTSIPLTLANAVYIGGAGSAASLVNNSITIADGAGNQRLMIDANGHSKITGDFVVGGDLYFDDAKTYGVTFDNSTRLYVKMSEFTALGFQNIGGAGIRLTTPQYSGQTTAALYPTYSFTQSESSGVYMDQTPAYGIVKIGFTTEGVRRFYIGSDEGTFTVPIKTTGYKSSDGSEGVTGTATGANTLIIKNGIITAIT